MATDDYLTHFEILLINSEVRLELHEDLCEALCGGEIPDSRCLNDAIRNLLEAAHRNHDSYWYYNPGNVVYYARHSKDFYQKCRAKLSAGSLGRKWTKRVEDGVKLSQELINYGARATERDYTTYHRIKETKDWDKRGRHRWSTPDLRDKDLGGHCVVTSLSEDNDEDSEQ